MATALLALEVRCRQAAPGDALVVAGSARELGAWSPARGLLLRTQPGQFPSWRGQVRIQAGRVDYKLVICRGGVGGPHQWEEGPNRQVIVADGGQASLSLGWEEFADDIQKEGERNEANETGVEA